MDSPNWNSNLSKYLLAAGVIIFGTGLSPTSRTGYEIWLTDYVKTGPEVIAGFTIIQMILIVSGLSLASYGIYYERRLT